MSTEGPRTRRAAGSRPPTDAGRSSVQTSRMRPGRCGSSSRPYQGSSAHALLARDPRDAAVHLPDQRVGDRIAAVPGQQLDDRDAQAEPLSLAHHPAQVGRDRGRRAPGADVVDAALDDQHVGAVGAVLEPAGDLVGQLRPARRSCGSRCPGRARSAHSSYWLRRSSCEPICSRMSGFGSQRGLPAVIESPSAATTVVPGGAGAGVGSSAPPQAGTTRSASSRRALFRRAAIEGILFRPRARVPRRKEP